MNSTVLYIHYVGQDSYKIYGVGMTVVFHTVLQICDSVVQGFTLETIHKLH